MELSDDQFRDSVSKLKYVDVVDMFSKEWFNNHENVININMYLHRHEEQLECIGNEYITNIATNKFDVLLRELISTYFVRFIKFDEYLNKKKKKKLLNTNNNNNNNSVNNTDKTNVEDDATSSITSYITLYHESTILNIFEMVLLNDSIYEHIDNYLINLFAYLYSNLVAFFKTDSSDYFVKPMAELNLDEMLTEDSDISYSNDKLKIYLNVINVLRIITDRIHLLSNSVINKIVDYDILLVLIPLMEKAPWRHGEYTFSRYEWMKCYQSELTDTEKQLWIIFYCLILNKTCQEKYEMTNYRRDNILKLRKYMNEKLYQQIPPMKTLHTFIEHLYLTKSVFPEYKNSYLIIDVVPEIYEDIKNDILKNRKNILSILNKVVIDRELLGNLALMYFAIYEYGQEYNKSSNKTKNETSEIVSDNNLNVTPEETVEEEEYRCNFCDQLAELQCSQCKNIYYCSKECQMNDWYKHRETCSNK